MKRGQVTPEVLTAAASLLLAIIAGCPAGCANNATAPFKAATDQKTTVPVSNESISPTSGSNVVVTYNVDGDGRISRLVNGKLVAEPIPTSQPGLEPLDGQANSGPGTAKASRAIVINTTITTGGTSPNASLTAAGTSNPSQSSTANPVTSPTQDITASMSFQAGFTAGLQASAQQNAAPAAAAKAGTATPATGAQAQTPTQNIPVTTTIPVNVNAGTAATQPATSQPAVK
jgi:hypothetical protein